MDLINLIIGFIDNSNLIWDFVTHVMLTYLFFKELKRIKNQKIIDTIYIIATTITGLILPVAALVHIYRLSSLDWIHVLFIIISICLILSYFVLTITLLFLKKYADKLFNGKESGL